MLSPEALTSEEKCLAGLRQINASLAAKVPDHNLPGLARWLSCGIRPGSFLTALLSNDLRGCMQNGDDENLGKLHELWQFLYMQIPSDAWGSRERMSAWTNRRANSIGELEGKQEIKLPYPWCRQPEICANRGSCPLVPNCGD